MQNSLVFAHFELRPAQRLLLAHGEAVELGSRAFDLLLALVERPGDLVRKDQLMERVWPHAIVEENNLHVQVSALRRALGVRAIVTVAGHGYRFALSVQDGGQVAHVRPAPDPPAPAGPHEAAVGPERRSATLLMLRFCHPPLAEWCADAEKMDALLGEVEHHVRAVLNRRGGLLMQLDTLGLTCVFGLPTTGEDDVVQAVEAALELIGAARGGLWPQAPAGRPALALRAGLAHAGVVASRCAHGCGWRVSGHLPALTAALCAAAAEHELLVSNDTGVLVAPYFDLDTRLPVPNDPTAEPAAAQAVRGRRRIATRIEAARWRGFTPLVGREHELGMLRRALADAVGGCGRAIHITAEAGVGKSRLVDEFCSAMAPDMAWVLRGRCHSQGRLGAYAPFIELLHQLLSVDQTVAAPRQSLIVGALLAIDGRLQACAAPVLHLLSMPDRVGSVPDGGPTRRALAEALLSVLTAAAGRRPLVLVLDDWHWADDASAEVLQLLVQTCVSHCLLVVACARPHAQSRWPRHEHCMQIVLTPMDRGQSAALIRGACGADAVPDWVVDAIHARTEGNAFFIEELCRALIGRGVMTVHDGRVHLQPAPQTLQLPSSVEAVIQSRLDQLPPETHALVKLASVVGREFARDEIELLVERPEGLAPALALLVDAALIQPTQMGSQPRYRFRHVLTQLVAYESLVTRQRREIHQRLGLLLEQRYGERIDEHLELIAYHFVNGTDPARAVDYSLRAGAKAATRAAHSMAARHVQYAVEQIEQEPATPQRNERLLSAYATLGQSLILLQGYAGREVAHVHARASALAGESGSGATRFKAVWMLWRYSYNRALLPEAAHLAAQLVLMAERSREPVQLVAAHTAEGVVRHFSGSFVQSLLSFDAALHTVDLQAEGRAAVDFGASPAVIAWTFKGVTLGYLGDFAAAEAACLRALTLGRELEHPGSLAFPLYYLAAFYLRYGLPHEAGTWIDALIDLSMRHEFPHWLALARVNRGIETVQSEAQGLQAGLDLIKAASETLSAMGVTLVRLPCHSVMAELLVRAGRPEEARAEMRLIEEAARAMGPSQADATLERLRGLVLLVAEPQRALQRFERAMAIARSQRALLLQMNIALDTADALLALRRPGPARSLLRASFAQSALPGHSQLARRAQRLLVAAELPSLARALP